MESTDRYSEMVNQINTDLPAGMMWDGFWIHAFDGDTLVISCAFDRLRYRNYDITFEKVTFFNVPEYWRDENMLSDSLLRMGTIGDFEWDFPDFDIAGRCLLSIDLCFRFKESNLLHNFYIVAEHFYLTKCTPGNCAPYGSYKDPLGGTAYPDMTNRVGIAG